MSRLLILILLVLVTSSAIGQTSGLAEPRLTVVPLLGGSANTLSPNLKGVLNNKVSRLLLDNNVFVSTDNADGIVFATNVVVESKDISTSLPTMYSLRLNITFYFGDGIDGVLFNSYTVNTTSLEKSEERAYLAAIRSLKTNSKELSAFFTEAKEKASQYYALKCTTVFKEVDVLVGKRLFDQSLQKLATIPTVNVDCYNKAMDKTIVVFNEKLKYECKTVVDRSRLLALQKSFDEAYTLLTSLTPDLDCYKEAKTALTELRENMCRYYLTQAKSAWASHNYTEATKQLSLIPPGSSCQASVNDLLTEIQKWYQQKENSALKLELRKYEDSQTRSRELIKAARDIGVAYGNGQPKVIYRTPWF